ncbi:MAG: NAD-dependent epimerase/dehydratase family protein [SAR324 cluster bacterium]|nr:NAD-dependent epimerase/dehydratase family protein [SAR324 cluster bacterium]
METICITGSNGFIGKCLMEEASVLNFSTYVWTKNEPDKLGHSQAIVHLAARVHQMKDFSFNPLQEFHQANCGLTLDLAKNGLEAGIKKFLFLSSVKIMGENPIQQTIYTEQDIPFPDDPYGISKWEAEQGLLELFTQQSNAQCIILRLPMVYGPGNKGNMLPLLKAVSRGIPLPFGSTKGKRSMIYVKNVCDAILTILQDSTPNRPPVQTYFINDNNDLTSGELYSLISQAYTGKKGVFSLPEILFRFGGEVGSRFEKLFGKRVPINNEIVSRLFDPYRFSCEKFCKDYDWTPPYTPEEGIRETVRWYQALSCEQGIAK